MTPYALSLFPEEDLGLWRQIRSLVEQLPDVDLGQDDDGRPIILSCHILCRALCRLLAVKTQDGLFADIYNHSWLVTRSGNVVDPYPVGILGGPIIVEGGLFGGFSPANRLYKPKRARHILHGLSQKSHFRRSVCRVRRAMQTIISSSKI